MKEQILVDNLLINYYKFKANGKKTLLFLHGWRSDGMIWKEIADILADEDVAIFALDFPGFGGSPAPKEAFSVKDYADLTAQFIEKLKLKNVILVGHSFGGRVAIKLAADNSTLIEKVVLVDSAGIKPNHLNTKKIMAKIVKPFFKPKFMQGVRKSIYKRIGSDDYLATPELQETFKKIVGEDLSDDLSKIKLPTLIIWGENDTETPAKDAEIMAKEIVDSHKVKLKDAGHFSFIDQSQEFITELTKFIK